MRIRVRGAAGRFQTRERAEGEMNSTGVLASIRFVLQARNDAIELCRSLLTVDPRDAKHSRPLCDWCYLSLQLRHQEGQLRAIAQAPCEQRHLIEGRR